MLHVVSECFSCPQTLQCAGRLDTLCSAKKRQRSATQKKHNCSGFLRAKTGGSFIARCLSVCEVRDSLFVVTTAQLDMLMAMQAHSDLLGPSRISIRLVCCLLLGFTIKHVKSGSVPFWKPSAWWRRVWPQVLHLTSFPFSPQATPIHSVFHFFSSDRHGSQTTILCPKDMLLSYHAHCAVPGAIDFLSLAPSLSLCLSLVASFVPTPSHFPVCPSSEHPLLFYLPPAIYCPACRPIFSPLESLPCACYQDRTARTCTAAHVCTSTKFRSAAVRHIQVRHATFAMYTHVEAAVPHNVSKCLQTATKENAGVWTGAKGRDELVQWQTQWP